MGLVSMLKQSTMIHLILAIIFFTSGVIINFGQCLLYFGLRPFSRYFYRKINYYLSYSIYSQLVFLAEWWSGSDIMLYVDKKDFEEYYTKEHAFIIINHTYEVDWFMGWVICERLGILGNSKAYVKKEVQYIPTLGWSWKFAECLFLERNWEKDKKIIGSQLKEIASYTDIVWLVLFAEGTRFTPEKLEASQKFAQKNGLPLLKYHLTPRTKGFIESIRHLQPNIPAIYNIQIEFEADSAVKPTVTSILYGKPIVAHVYIKRIPIETIPKDDKAAAEWLHKLYQEKDRLAESFHQTGDFFATSGVAKVNRIIIKRRCYALVNTVCWAVIILVPVIYYLVNLSLSGSTVYFSIGVGIIFLSYLLMRQLIKMSKISHSSSYGTNDKKSK